MLSGHPYSRLIAASVLAGMAAAGAWACGGSTSTSVVGPDNPRCQTSVTGQPTSLPHTGGQITVTVGAARDCTWEASTDAGWMQLSSTSGQGDGTFTATANANDRGNSRTAAVIVNDQRLAVVQEPRPCAFNLTASPNQISSAGGRGSIHIETGNGCTWTASSGVSWLRMLTTTGEGPGEAAFEVTANTGGPRDATVTVGGHPVMVSQTGAGGDPGPPGPDCAATVGPTPLSAPASGGPQTVTLAIAPPCEWTATSTADWVTVEPPKGRGPTNLTLTVANNTGAARSATITVAGQTVTINQAAVPPCTYSIDDASNSFPADGGQGTVRVTTQGHCTWSASGAPGWISVSSSPRTGEGNITYTVQPNTTTSARSARLTIAGRSHEVTQAAAAPTCTYRVEPASASVGAGGGNGQFSVVTEAGCAWSAQSDQGWAIVNTQSGTGPGPVSYRAEPNGTTSERSARITVNGQTHTVTQAAAAPTCTYRVEPPSSSVGADGGPGGFNVVTEQGCAWEARSDQGWAIVNTPAGAGPGPVSYTAQANGTPAERSARIMVNGQTHTVTQAGVTPTCTYRVDPTGASIGSGGGSGTFTVLTEQGCAWEARSDQSWATVNTPAGAGTGPVSYSVEANGTMSERSARITVNGQTHTVTQAAAAPQICEYRVQPGSAVFGAAGGDGEFNVITDEGCAWSAASAAGWTQVNTREGDGPAEIAYRVDRNTSGSGRATAISVNGRLHFVLQGGASGDGDLHPILTARLPRALTDEPYCPSCTVQHSYWQH